MACVCCIPSQKSVLNNPEKWARTDNLDLAEWDTTAQVPKVFDPPQWENYYSAKQSQCVNWYTHRAPCCVQVPCCCVPVCFSCMGAHIIDIGNEDNDKWMHQMLAPKRRHPLCPEELAGIWWMDGNVVGEVVVTFEDGMWRTSSLGLKPVLRNWSRDNTILGLFMFFFTAWPCRPSRQVAMRTEVSPAKRWIQINEHWICLVKPEDDIRNADGSPLNWDPTDMMRVSYRDHTDPTSEIVYQYRVRRIAYMDREGNLVKTDAYKELAELARAKQEYPGSCCNYGPVPMADITYGKALKVMNRWQQMVLSPPIQQDIQGGIV